MESMSRISSLLETARDLTLEAAHSTSSHRPTPPTRPVSAAQIKKLLDSRSERDVLDGLRRVIAMQYAQPPQPTLTFFPAVLKTLSHPYPSTRPLVYNYLLHHAEADPDTALLAVNTIQKSLSDSNPRVRAMALKTMSGIRVPVLSAIIVLAIKKGVSDLSPLVRKVAALACIKCVRLDSNTRPQVEEYIATLLADKQYYVAGAAVQAFMEICPERIDFIHPVYRRLCRMVVDMDEWGQLAVLRLMTVYARKCFPRRTKQVKKAPATQEEKARDFYDELEPDSASYEDVELVDPDLTLLLTSTAPLLQSRNAAIIIAATRLYLHLSPTTHLPSAISPLIALLRSPQDIQITALHNIVSLCLRYPKLFVPYMRHFLLHSTDTTSVRSLKLELLTLIFPHCGNEIQDLTLAELEHFSHSSNLDLVRESVRALGRCAASSSPKTARRCLSLLLKQLRSSDQMLVGESMEVIRHLIQRDPSAHRRTVVRLAKNLDTLTSPMARASIVWLVGEYAAGLTEEGEGNEGVIAADVLRVLVKGYADESEEVKAQIVLLAAKVYLHYLNSKTAKRKALDALNGRSSLDQDLEPEPEPESEPADEPHAIELLYAHALLLARYTPSYTLRDRTRLYRALLSNTRSTELATLLLLAPKPVPLAPSPSEARKDLPLGSASLVVGEALKGEDIVPDWVREGEEPDPRLRDAGGEGEKKVGGSVSAGQKLGEALAADQQVKGDGSGAGAGRKEKTLEDWLGEEGGSEESEEETETEESDEEESETESESESEEDEKAGLVK